MRQIADYLKIPLISLEHCDVPPNVSPSQLAQMKQRFTAQKHIFITEYSRDRWGYSSEEALVIEHGINTNIFSPAKEPEFKGHILTVCNEFESPERHWCCGFPLWGRVTKDLPVKHVGKSKTGWSQPAKNTTELVGFYREAAVFFNPASASPVPTVLLEAMACGSVVVSLASCAVPSIIKHGVNGFLSNDEQELRAILADVLAKPDDFEDIRANARQTIIDRYSLELHLKKWDKVLRSVVHEV
jgi:hypothetical protein